MLRQVRLGHGRRILLREGFRSLPPLLRHRGEKGQGGEQERARRGREEIARRGKEERKDRNKGRRERAGRV
ncbi:hypothetical protein Pmani_032732 [Petrolisthes manimaculis]|uniref:Uncharacterized protein n=1 Tax=Petrolisthes manimaculis TaxID=1843537 RepID=A0AAE1NSS5_9EUCA|nr:hypothetical protein Pmani_032732 [Petrolisthes manimaculis]